jgi:hypothetical protein
MSHRPDLPPEHLVAEPVGLLDDAFEIDEPAVLELLAGTLLLPISITKVPEPARRVVIDAIEARADPIASATLAALAVLAPSPLAAYAHEAAVRPAGRGVTHPAVAQTGTLSVDSAAAGADRCRPRLAQHLVDAAATDGPVQVTLEYRPRRRRDRDLIEALRAGRHARRRTGAISWRVWRDAANPGRVLEQFVVGSWNNTSASPNASASATSSASTRSGR